MIIKVALYKNKIYNICIYITYIQSQYINYICILYSIKYIHYNVYLVFIVYIYSNEWVN